MWETDLTFCISEMASTGQPGFYLIDGLGTGRSNWIMGSIVRKVAVDLTTSSRQKPLLLELKMRWSPINSPAGIWEIVIA
jgi:hypothetical protein